MQGIAEETPLAENAKSQKGTTSRLIDKSDKGGSVNVNKTTQSVCIEGKEKVPLAPKTVPQAEKRLESGVNRETIDCKTPQV